MTHKITDQALTPFTFGTGLAATQKRHLRIERMMEACISYSNAIARSIFSVGMNSMMLFVFQLPLVIEVHAEVNSDSLSPDTLQLERGPLSDDFDRQVRPRLNISDASARAYVKQLDAALTAAHVEVPAPKFIVLIDRNTLVQAAILFWGAPTSGWRMIGAAPVSTGLPGKYEHFLTPLGVFEHTRDNPDFRATGIKNKLGIRGYGRKDSRVYDFGWVASPRGWGNHSPGQLRFQMHSTDADILAQRLGTAQSEGCVRIPALLNEFIDRYGILDEDYDRAVANGSHLWILRADRATTPWSGRFLVVVESGDTTRPVWSQLSTIQYH